MRRAALVLAVFVLAAFLPQVPAVAACRVQPPPRATPEGRETILNYKLVVVGFIDGKTIPKDAHGAYSFRFTVRRFFAGGGRDEIEITSYASLDLPEGFEKPGSARKGTVNFLAKFGGQPAILFLVHPDTARGRDKQHLYKDEYATSDCVYNVIGQQQVAAFLPLLQEIYSGVPASVAPTASPTPTSTTVIDVRAAAPKAKTEDEGRGGPITRAAGLIVLVGAGLWLYRSPKSPLFERWR